MRAFAVITVVVDHTLLALHILNVGRWESHFIGDFGVYLFFLHTSLVLMWSLDRRPHVLDFYIRRAFRIYPLLWASMLAILAFHAPLVGPVDHFFEWHHMTWQDVLVSGLLLHNIIPRFYPTHVMWTLPLEMQMYVLLPLLFFFVQKNKVLWPLLLFWALAVRYCFHVEVNTGEFNLVQSMPLFLSGVIAYVGFKRFTPKLPAWPFAVLIAGMFAAFMHGPTHHRAWYSILILGLTLPFFRQTRVMWLQRIGHTIAKYSYGVYLTHSLALVLGIYLMPRTSRWIQIPVAFAALCLMSYVAYNFIEAPMIRRGAMLAGRIERKYEQGLFVA